MKNNKYWLTILMAAILLCFNFQGAYKAVEHSELIRLHVIANSDSPEDQALKNRVRDELLFAFSSYFEASETLEKTRELIEYKLSDIEGIAWEQIAGSGFSYPVNAQLGRYAFPTKVYGDVVYPAGRYEALRVVIGEGQGANWWCVMFPPLCFVDITSGVAKQKTTLEVTPSNTVQSTKGKSIEDKPETEVVYTFKLFEWWKQRISPWIARTFSKK